MMIPLGTNALGALVPLRIAASAHGRLGRDARALPFWLVEFEGYRPGSTVIGYDYGLGAVPLGALALATDELEDNATFRASDRGYVADPGDPGRQMVYPPLLETAFEADREIDLDPTRPAAGFSWGTVRLANPDSRWNGVVEGYVNDGRRLRILFGAKTYDETRGLHVDPPGDELTEVFTGIQQPWSLGEHTLDIPIRDAGYEIEVPVQGGVYTGAGGANGTPDMTGLSIPRARGGTPSDPIRNVSPVLIDPTGRIYQYTDGAGRVVALYERGAAVFSYAGDFASYAALVAASVPSGSYATCNARGLIRLGAVAVGQVTADVTGDFPAAGGVSTVAGLALRTLTDDLGIDPVWIDTAAFLGLDAACPYAAGYWIGTEPRDGAAVLGDILGSIGAKLTTGRNGKLRPFLPGPPTTGTRPVVTYTAAQIVSMVPRPLPASLSPPAYRWRVGYQRNHSVQAGDLSPLAGDARRQFLANEFRYASWIDVGLLSSYRRPNDPAPLPTVLLDRADAQAVADQLGSAWGVRRRLYDVTLWLTPLEREIGDPIVVQYPLDDFGGGKLCTVVGDRVRSGDSTVTLQILV
jgi:hypothetical protein